MLCASFAISVRVLLLHTRTLLSLPANTLNIPHRDNTWEHSQTAANRFPSEQCVIERTPTSSSPFNFTVYKPLEVGQLNVRIRLVSGELGVGDAARFTPRPGDHADAGAGPFCAGAFGSREFRPCDDFVDVGESSGFDDEIGDASTGVVGSGSSLASGEPKRVRILRRAGPLVLRASATVFSWA